MRKGHYLIAAAGLVGSAATILAGCIDYRAEYYLPLTEPSLLDGGPDADSGPPPGCIPSGNTQAVADTCGVFVSSSKGSDANGKGTKEAPYATLTKALGAAKGKPVYACGETFAAEMVSIDANATLFGALDCANGWVHDGTKKTQLAPTMEGIALTISKATTSVEVYDFAITSASATQAGGSSIAVLVAQASASFTSCDIVAGDGKDGDAGKTYQNAAQTGGPGNKGNDACSASTVVGADPVTNACGNPDSISGSGGNGRATNGDNGSDGKPLGTKNGGGGEDTAACEPGTQGDDGDKIGLATPGLGATGIGTISASGYVGPSSGDGGAGKPGQGGGGGGGAKGGTGAGMCSAPTSAGGASGGSGGAGGCGGLGGEAGSAGGSSIALVSIDATLSFTGTTLKGGTGGNGGNGGNGQTGGSGGDGASGGGVGAATSLKPGCPGGKGGTGGAGGKGGGGLGGHSLGLAFTGKAPPASGWTATPKAGGTGGAGDDTGGNKGTGDGGLSCKSLDFGDATSCVQ